MSYMHGLPIEGTYHDCATRGYGRTRLRTEPYETNRCFNRFFVRGVGQNYGRNDVIGRNGRKVHELVGRSYGPLVAVVEGRSILRRVRYDEGRVLADAGAYRKRVEDVLEVAVGRPRTAHGDGRVKIVWIRGRRSD